MPKRLDRRQFISTAAAGVAALSGGCAIPRIDVRSPYGSAIPDVETATLVNDMHSQLNATRVHSIVKPATVEDVATVIRGASEAGRSVAMAGGRHAMGGQQFAEEAVLLDTRALNRILEFDRTAGTVTLEAGVQWPQLISYLHAQQEVSGATEGQQPS